MVFYNLKYYWILKFAICTVPEEARATINNKTGVPIQIFKQKISGGLIHELDIGVGASRILNTFIGVYYLFIAYMIVDINNRRTFCYNKHSGEGTSSWKVFGYCPWACDWRCPWFVFNLFTTEILNSWLDGFKPVISYELTPEGAKISWAIPGYNGTISKYTLYQVRKVGKRRPRVMVDIFYRTHHKKNTLPPTRGLTYLH